MLLSLLAGLVLILIGAEAVLRGASTVRKRFRIPSFVIGLVLIGFGTSLPELGVSTGATLAGFEGIALGLLLGSFLVNLALILGLCALIRPIGVSANAVGRDGVATVVAAVYLLLGAILEPTGLIWPLIGFALFALYLVLTLMEERRMAGTGVMGRKADLMRPGPARTALGFGLLIIGLIGIGGGAALLVQGSTGYAADIGVPLPIIGLALLALITSIPEAVVSIHSAVRGQGDVAVANLLGSNIFNLLFVLPLCQLLLSGEASFFAGPWAMHAYAAVLIGLIAYGFILSGRTIRRAEGAVLLLAYGGYLLAAIAP